MGTQGRRALGLESVELGKAREEFLRETSTLRVASRAYERAKTLVEAKAISAGEFQAREGEYLSRKAAARCRRANAPPSRRQRRRDPEPEGRGGGGRRRAVPSGDAPR